MTDYPAAILEVLGRGPQSLPQLACHLHQRGEPLPSMYATTRRWIHEMETDGRIERCGEGMNTCWRLPANTTFETPKGTR